MTKYFISKPLPSLALLALLASCYTHDPVQARPISMHVGSAEHGGQLGVGVHQYTYGDTSFFASFGFSGDMGEDYPEYDAGTAAFFGDPQVDVERSALGLGLGPTYTWRLDEANGFEAIGIYAGPYFGVKEETPVFDDPTNILEQGTGGYTEPGDSNFEVGVIVGLHLMFDAFAVGVQYDTFHEGVAASLAIDFGRAN